MNLRQLTEQTIQIFHPQAQPVIPAVVQVYVDTNDLILHTAPSGIPVVGTVRASVYDDSVFNPATGNWGAWMTFTDLWVQTQAGHQMTVSKWLAEGTFTLLLKANEVE